MAKRKKRTQPPLSPFTCAWCEMRIPEDTEVFSLSSKSARGIDLKAHAGKIIPLYLVLAKKSVPAIVAEEGSPAKKDGHDIAFIFCSEKCMEALAVALQIENELAGGMRLN